MSVYGTTNSIGHISKGEVFTLLANPRRRYALHYLRQVNGTAELREMADRIAAWEAGSTVEGLTSNQRKKVYTSLQQTHLQKLQDAGIVKYDRQEGVIEATPAARELEVYLEVVPEREFPWREYYLALGAISSALVIVAWANVGPFGAVGDAVWAGLIAGTLTISAAIQIYYEQHMQVGMGDQPPEIEG